MVYMLQIGMIVKILPDAEYSGKFTGYIGKVKNYFSQNKKVGVELFQQTNDASSKGLFWFSEDKLALVEGPNFWGSVSESLSGIFHQSGSRLHRAGIPPCEESYLQRPQDRCSLG